MEAIGGRMQSQSEGYRGNCILSAELVLLQRINAVLDHAVLFTQAHSPSDMHVQTFLHCSCYST